MASQTFNISLPEDLVKRTDKAAKKVYKNRSEFIRDAIVSKLKEDDGWDEIFAEGRKIGKKMGIKSEEDVVKMIKEYRREKREAQNSSR